MYVGLCRLTLALPGNRSLKGKRQVVRRISERLKHKFHAAVAEVGDPERWSEAEVGFAVVSGNERQARAMAENIVLFVEESMIAPLTEVELEVLSFDDLAMGESFNEVERWGDGGWEKIGMVDERGRDEE